MTQNSKSQWRNSAQAIVLCLALTFDCAAQKLELPKPTGPYAVGTVIKHWVDSARELMAQIWYPAQPDAQTAFAPYIPEFDQLFPHRKILAERGFTLLGRGIEQLKPLRTHAKFALPLATALPRYPVLIFSPGNSVPRSNYTTLMEELASHGYIVAGIDHPYSVAIVAFPDGRVAIMPPDTETNRTPFEERVGTRAADMRFVLDQLAQLTANDPEARFTGRLDWERIGLFGHSIGGVASVLTAAQDRRIKAAINLDGGTGEIGDSLQRNIEQPFMLMTKSVPFTKPTGKQLVSWGMSKEQYDAFMAKDAERKRAVINEKVKSVAYQVTLQGAQHMSFSDSPLLEGDNHGLNARRALRIVCDYSLAFFNRYLKNQETALLDGASALYPEVKVEKYLPAK